MKRLLLLALVSVSLLPIAGVEGAATRYRIRQLDGLRVRWPTTSDHYLFDMAFERDLMAVGITQTPMENLKVGTGENTGFALFRLLRERPHLQQIGSYNCQSAGDVSLWGRLAIVSVLEDPTPNNADRCNAAGREGLALVDISDPRRPREVGFVPLRCGSAVNTVVPYRKKLYVYSPSSCQEGFDNPMGFGALSELAVVRIDPHAPERSKVSSYPSLAPHGGCYDMIFHAARDLVVCFGDNRWILLDASEPTDPHILNPPGNAESTVPQAATFTWDGQYLVVAASSNSCDGDESGGQPGLSFYNIEDPSNPVLAGQWSAPIVDHSERCFVRNVSVLPTRNKSKYLALVSYQHGGLRVVDFSDPAAARQIAFFTSTHPSSDPRDDGVDEFSFSYWYNGRIYAHSTTLLLEQDGDKPYMEMRALKMSRALDRRLRRFRARFNPNLMVPEFR